MSNDLRPHLKLKEIRSVENRTYDVGGGGGTYPRNDYRRHANNIFKQTQQLKRAIEQAKDGNLTTKRYFRVELPDDKSILRSEGGKLSQNILGNLVGAPQKTVGHFSTIKNSLNSLLDQIKEYSTSEKNTGKSKFSVINKIANIPASEKVSKSLQAIMDSGKEPGEILVSLFPDLSRDEAITIKNAITEYLNESEGSIISEYDGATGKILKIKTKRNTIKNLAECFLAIQTVDPVEDFLVEAAVTGAPIGDSVTVSPNNSNAKVCVFDSGVVKNSRFFDASIIAHEEPIGPPHNVDHGTFVASRIIYGNDIRDAIASGQLIPDVKILSVCMKTHDEVGNPLPASGDDFIKIVRDTVQRWHREIKVYNLSMNLRIKSTGHPAIVEDDHVSPLAAELDNLSKKYGVLFVVTTGNFPMSNEEPLPTSNYPEYFKDEATRLCHPGEAMLALTVGSIADRANNGSMAQRNTPSPFTRRGPGFNSYRKPDLVAPGGNYANNWRHFDDLAVTGIDHGGGNIAYGSGTSYAAPIISRLAAKVFEHIKDATPDLVRALLIHATQLCGKEHLDDEELLLQLVGNGESETSFLLNSDRWNQHFVYQGKVGYRKIIKIPFYVPSVLTKRKGRKKVRVRFTLAFSPETNRTLKSGYCKSHLRTKLYKRNESGDLHGTNSSKNHVTISDRYSTVIRYNKEFTRGLQNGDWEILVEQESRWMLKNPDTPFAFVLTISDPRNSPDVDIYQSIQSEVKNRFEDLIPILERIRT